MAFSFTSISKFINLISTAELFSRIPNLKYCFVFFPNSFHILSYVTDLGERAYLGEIVKINLIIDFHVKFIAEFENVVNSILTISAEWALFPKLVTNIFLHISSILAGRIISKPLFIYKEEVKN